ncbi:MAG: DUF547 domain-containing protein [Leptospiraceae bacterium]|nr:DUF547 domain-containing protein [Leptospiraceae bacterium]
MKKILLLLLIIPNILLSFDHNHTAFDGILKKYVRNGKVNYKGIKKVENSFNSYLNSLSAVSQSQYNGFNKNQKLSFLINAYNAFTIKLILDNYPLKSIKSIGFLPGAAWKKEFFKLLGQERNLDWIEHQQLRVKFNEPRIHFAIVCASIGCPPLISEAFTPEKLETQLEANTEKFLKDKSKNKYDPSKKILYISPIFKWFKKDFEKNGSVISFVKKFMGVDIPEKSEIEYTYYNWNLNEQ